MSKIEDEIVAYDLLRYLVFATLVAAADFPILVYFVDGPLCCDSFVEVLAQAVLEQLLNVKRQLLDVILVFLQKTGLILNLADHFLVLRSVPRLLLCENLKYQATETPHIKLMPECARQAQLIPEEEFRTEVSETSGVRLVPTARLPRLRGIEAVVTQLQIIEFIHVNVARLQIGVHNLSAV